MLTLFIITLFLTFIIVRIAAHTLHDMENYGTKKDKSKTFTSYLRHKTSLDIHHFHIGILILLIAVLSILLTDLNNIITIFLAIGISLVLDQTAPIINRKSNYFHIKNLIISFILHSLVSVTVIIISSSTS